MHKLEMQLRLMEARLDLQRAMLTAQAMTTKALLHHRLTAPRTLLAVVAGGIALGWLCRRPRHAAASPEAGMPRFKRWWPWVVRLAPLIAALLPKHTGALRE